MHRVPLHAVTRPRAVSLTLFGVVYVWQYAYVPRTFAAATPQPMLPVGERNQRTDAAADCADDPAAATQSASRATRLTTVERTVDIGR
jgi:hypothetical protein